MYRLRFVVFDENDARKMTEKEKKVKRYAQNIIINPRKRARISITVHKIFYFCYNSHLFRMHRSIKIKSYLMLVSVADFGVRLHFFKRAI